MAEVTSMLISKDAFSNISITPREFPKVKVDTSWGRVPGVPLTSLVISPVNYTGNVTDCVLFHRYRHTDTNNDT